MMWREEHSGPHTQLCREHSRRCVHLWRIQSGVLGSGQVRLSRATHSARHIRYFFYAVTAFYIVFFLSLIVSSGLQTPGLGGLVVAWLMAALVMTAGFFFTESIAWPLLRFWMWLVVIQTALVCMFAMAKKPVGFATSLPEAGAKTAFLLSAGPAAAVALVLAASIPISDNAATSAVSATTVASSASYLLFIAGVTRRVPFNALSLFLVPSQVKLAVWDVTLLLLE